MHGSRSRKKWEEAKNKSIIFSLDGKEVNKLVRELGGKNDRYQQDKLVIRIIPN